VNTVRFLTDPVLLSLYWPGVLAGIAIAIVCASLSPLVVLKRLSFVGQGISHAAFGGIGLAAAIGAVGGAGAAAVQGPGQFLIVLLFCLGAAALIGSLIERGASQADTAIGIVLVASMTLGAILIQWSMTHGASRARLQSWESILFGSILAVGPGDAALAWASAAVILAACWWFRRPLLFWAFDEPAARAFGVPTSAMKFLLIVLLTLAIVTAMKLAGVVLATALLVLPGATALRLSDRWGVVLAWSLGSGVAGVVGGLVLSFESEVLPPGACIVAVLTILFAAARLITGVQSARSAA
jgi:ABC-type Mn2+/Zn2+ transport system permease subunit